MNITALPTILCIVLFASASACQQAGNPLGQTAPAADPFARTFANDRLSLSLHPAPDGYAGELRVGDQVCAVSAAATGNGIRGAFAAGQDRFEFTASLDGDLLALESDGVRHELRARAAAMPKPLTGVYDGKVTSYRHPDGYFSLELPTGWSQAKKDGGQVLFNPGLAATDTLDCLLFVSVGELDADERNVAVTDLLDRQETALRQAMRAQQVNLQPARGKASAVLVGELPGAEQQWVGQANGHAVTMWVGALAVREYYFATVAVIVQGQEERFLPGVKRMFRSVQPGAPQRDGAGGALLAGAEYAHEEFYSSGSTVTTYTFAADGSVRRRHMLSGSLGISGHVDHDSGDLGRWRVVGKQLVLRFDDGERTAELLHSDGRIAGFRIGRSLYSRL